LSTTLKIAYLKTLTRLKRKSIVAKSVFGYPYRISLGDMFSENPFYNKRANVGEVLATAAWVLQKQGPIIFDIGGHCGYIASQLAQILKKNKPVIYSFEPVAPTFSDLVQSVDELSLHEYIHPISMALSDEPGLVRLNYSRWNSMLAQIVPPGTVSNARAGSQIYYAPSDTLDEFCGITGSPDVIKIDVEGWETNVFRGARNFVSSPAREQTGICLEWNPEALENAGSSPAALYEIIGGYRFFYINDYEGQKVPLLQEVRNPLELKHCCNLFAMSPAGDAERWKHAFFDLKNRFRVEV
jgi:FkbM family methyltransferase